MGFRSAALVTCLFVTGTWVYAQEFRASLTGRVLDAAGAPVANAKVRITNGATGDERETLADGQGNYLLPLLNPATYTISAEAPGFKTAVQQNLVLNVNQAATLDLKRELGSMNAKVTVTAEAPVLDDANGDRGGVVDEQ